MAMFKKNKEKPNEMKIMNRACESVFIPRVDVSTHRQQDGFMEPQVPIPTAFRPTCI